ncbi:MAG: methylated-DNA--[protein]-cysteine S-methyltransferase [Solirubrobacteraceae bacterium]
MNHTTLLPTPIGPLTIEASPRGVRRMEFGARSVDTDPQSAILELAVSQLREYFAGERRTFELELDLGGTEFQRRLWSALQELPYGTSTTYGTLAGRFWADPIEARLHARAIGAAVGATPVPIIVPCHRVLGADGSLTGYRGGLAIKRALLDFEASGGSAQALRTPEQLALV